LLFAANLDLSEHESQHQNPILSVWGRNYRLKLQSTYGGYDPGASHLYYSTIDIFKGLEADVVFVLLGTRFQGDEAAKAFYVQGSRAKHALYVYQRE
jgi:hypothetical protein